MEQIYLFGFRKATRREEKIWIQNQPLRQEKSVTQRQLISEVQIVLLSELSFSLTGCITQVKKA